MGSRGERRKLLRSKLEEMFTPLMEYLSGQVDVNAELNNGSSGRLQQLENIKIGLEKDKEYLWPLATHHCSINDCATIFSSFCVQVFACSVGFIKQIYNTSPYFSNFWRKKVEIHVIHFTSVSATLVAEQCCLLTSEQWQIPQTMCLHGMEARQPWMPMKKGAKCMYWVRRKMSDICVLRGCLPDLTPMEICTGP